MHRVITRSWAEGYLDTKTIWVICWNLHSLEHISKCKELAMDPHNAQISTGSMADPDHNLYMKLIDDAENRKGPRAG